MKTNFKMLVLLLILGTFLIKWTFIRSTDTQHKDNQHKDGQDKDNQYNKAEYADTFIRVESCSVLLRVTILPIMPSVVI
jgi:hypothetical protein